MSRKRNPLLFLTDIASAIERIKSYTKSGKREFFNNTAFQDATFFRLQTIGEAVNQLPQEYKDRYPEIRWKDEVAVSEETSDTRDNRIVGFRNILAHRYWRIDLNSVWGLFEPNGDLDRLNLVVQELINELSGENN